MKDTNGLNIWIFKKRITIWNSASREGPLNIWSNHLINGTGFLFLEMGSSASPYWEVIQVGVGSISNTSVVNIIARVERKERLHARLYTCVFFFSFSSGMHYMLVIIRENKKKKKKKKRKRWKLICGQEGISIYIAEDIGGAPLSVRRPRLAVKGW